MRAARAAASAWRTAAALFGARCASNHASAAASGSSATAWTRPIAMRLVGADGASGQQQVLGGRRADPVRQQHRGGRGEDAELRSPAVPAARPARRRSRLPASATSSPPPRHWPRTATSIGAGNASIARISACSDRSIAGAGAGQVLLDAGAEAEVRAVGVEQHAAQRRHPGVAGEGGVERRDHRRVDDVGLGPRQSRGAAARRRAPARPAAAWSRGGQPRRAAGIRPSVKASSQAWPRASAWRSATKSTSRVPSCPR